MANTIAIKGRIRSVRNTRQITKAMELVSASKMRRAQENAQRSRDFSRLAQDILARLRALTDVNSHPLYERRAVKNRLVLIISSDQGLAGAYNANLFKIFASDLLQDQQAGIHTQVIVIGKQGSRMVSRVSGIDVVGVYHDFPTPPSADDLRPILTTVLETFTKKTVDAVDVFYTDYKSSITQVAKKLRLLPAAFDESIQSPEDNDAVFEPSPTAVLKKVTERFIEANLSQCFSESQASEQAMRMMAMKNASDNATDIIDDLTLLFNSARQAAITQEIAEITGGAEAIK